MKGAVVDASVWVSRLVDGDTHHELCTSWLERQTSAGGLVIAPTLVLAEVAGAISRRTRRPELAHQAVEAMQALPGLRLVSIDPPLADLAARLASDHGLRGADAVYVATASHLGLPLCTLDSEQLHRAGPVVAASTP
jgi:predicted nucleic acid-binding protein